MNRQLLLKNIRNVLMRLEESIIFALIERSQFMYNQLIYQPSTWPQAIGDESIIGFLLHACERNHAQLRRYTSPDEHPFYDDLPLPLLPQLRFEENPLKTNSINLNHKIRPIYEQSIVPFICEDGDDSQYGSSAVCDVNCLQTISKRIHYGKFVAESKYRANPKKFQEPIRQQDQAALHELITDQPMEQRVLERVSLKANTYGRDLDDIEPRNLEKSKIPPEKIATVYRQWIIPLTKEVEILYLLERE